MHLSAQELEQIYAVTGHFYALHLPGVAPLQCRSVLEIRSENIPMGRLPDAIFVMMNPGSSKPINGCELVRNADTAITTPPDLVATIPDPTQYQVMRVMHCLGWQYVRVINLSDIRNPKSIAFTKIFPEAEKSHCGRIHSVFSPERRLELQQYLKRKPTAPIVRAWGLSNKLTPLTRQAQSALKQEVHLSGLTKTNCDDKFLHPLPRLQKQKEEWTVQMINHLKLLLPT